jgi:hypothetical protein
MTRTCDTVRIMSGRIFTPALAPFLLLAACAGGLSGVERPGVTDAAPETLDPAMSAPPPPVGAVTAEALDTTTEEQRAAAMAAPVAAERELGRVAVSLGTATDPGFWLRSTLVEVQTPGRVVTASGGTLQVELLPGDGAAQLSLSAFRALDLSLTALPEVTVFALAQ